MISILSEMGRFFLGELKSLILNGLCILLICIYFLEHEDIQIACSNRYRVINNLKVWNMKMSDILR